MIKATEWNVLDKLLFASDYPVTTAAAETFESLRNVNEHCGEGTKLSQEFRKRNWKRSFIAIR